MDFLNNPVLIAVVQFVWGELVKRLPWLAAWPNRFIPWFNTVLAFLMKVIGGGVGPATHPAVFSLLLSPVETMGVMLVGGTALASYQVAGWFPSSLVLKVADAAWSALLVSLLHDKFAQ